MGTGKNCLIAAITLCVLLIVGILVAYFVVIPQIEGGIEESGEVCNSKKSLDNFESNSDNANARLSLYPFNLTNPLEFLDGGSADLYNMGPYGVDMTPVRANASLEDSKSVLKYDQWFEYRKNFEETCDTCDFTDEFTIVNHAYQALLMKVGNEGTLLLGMQGCSPDSIALISSTNPSIPYCEGDYSAPCRCCSAMYNPNFPNRTLCSSYITSTGSQSGFLSWLAKMNRGTKISSTQTDFLLLKGLYTPAIRKVYVTETMWGYMDSMIGMFRTRVAIRDGDMEQVAYYDQNTKDTIDACGNLCPTYQSLVGRIKSGENMVSVLRGVECVARVPDTAGLVSLGLTEERALELRYMEGMSCSPLGVNIVMAALVTVAPGSNFACADGSTNLPCCMSVISIPAMSIVGQGLGCMHQVSGTLQVRRVYSHEEAQLHVKTKIKEKSYTGCAEEQDQFQVITSKGVTEQRGWFTPSTYEVGGSTAAGTAMNWADGVIYRKALRGLIPGTWEPAVTSGNGLFKRKGTGVTSGFWDRQISDGEPDEAEPEDWTVYLRRQTRTKILRSPNTRFGFKTNRFAADLVVSTNTTDIEASERNGNNPAQNMNNNMYNLDLPIIVSFPMFYRSEERMLSQTDNQDRISSSTSGVNLYRTRSDYSKDSTTITPELITAENWEEFGLSDYRGSVDIEPATGISLAGVIVNQVSIFTFNCNPMLDPSCGLKGSLAADGEMCYNQQGVTFPCNQANVLSPKMMGGKVLPWTWFTINAELPDSAIDSLNVAADTRIALSVLVVILPILSAIAICILVWLLSNAYSESATPGYVTAKTDHLEEFVEMTTAKTAEEVSSEAAGEETRMASYQDDGTEAL